ncbi:exodeoxyribonuclease VII small subunit [Corynebacterium sp. 13CS0277]|uniref:exodeoxyribonuclease VII small subunit n=1 Tax=Corynebacterium sp. 13CS0277 TaxID=2071994 RepID=UPI000D046C52|nr:exodeoxyribonuclease VII small subunit [Corynebacterium sp. 13CS0277]PRQ12253.1 exodeoxyribonuclease VII small subunit [Corynebacterium sp. 13CS0277]
MTQPTSFGTGTPGELADPQTLTYEQAREELVETVKILELGQMTLDEALAYWERGEALARRCEEQLGAAQQRISQVLGDAQHDAAE